MSVMSAASMATSAPVPMAIPTSAWASAGASLMPSPTIATTWPRPCSRDTIAAFSAGCTSARTRCNGMPTWRATASAVALPSPVTSQASMPAALEPVDRLGALGLDRIADDDEPGRPVHRPPRRRTVRPSAAAWSAAASERVDVHAAVAHQARAADEHGPRPVGRLDPTLDPAAGDRREAVDPPEAELVTQGARADGGSERMLAALLERAREVEDVRHAWTRRPA